jgi:L-arabinokinase
MVERERGGLALICILIRMGSGKIGYGTTSESLAHNVPLVFVRRAHFNEEPFLRKLLELNDCMVEMTQRDFFQGHWHPYLQRALLLRPHYKGALDGQEPKP